MVTRHFFGGDSRHIHVITYHALEHIPFAAGFYNTLPYAYGSNILDDGSFKLNKFTLLEDKFEDGVGSYVIQSSPEIHGFVLSSSPLPNIVTPQDILAVDGVYVGSYFVGLYHNNEGLRYTLLDYEPIYIKVSGLLLSINSLVFASGYTVDDQPYNYSVEEVDIDGSIKDINREVFANCTALRIIRLPHTIEYIGSNVFLNCPKLTTIIFNGTLQQWEDIEKNEYWNNGMISGIQLQCSDGTITL